LIAQQEETQRQRWREQHHLRAMQLPLQQPSWLPQRRPSVG
jgi:hypothetical protein